jgi:hypothetical protein
MVDIGSDADGRVAGSVTAVGERPLAFTGWLELLRLLERSTDARRGADPHPVTGDRQET